MYKSFVRGTNSVLNTSLLDQDNASLSGSQVSTQHNQSGLNINIQDMFHVYLNRFEFHFCGRIKYKQTNFAVSYMTDVSLVLPTRQSDNLKHNNNMVVLNTSPPPFN